MWDTIKRNWVKYVFRLVPLLLGAAGGYAYYHYIGCASGTCAITSNPTISTVYGAVLGALVSSSILPGKRAQKKEEETHG